MGLVSELRRRNVFRMAALYLVAAWLIMQVAGEFIDLGNLPDWIGPIILALLAVGFPIALVLSWFYEITPEGLSLEKDVEPDESITHITGRRLDFVVISLLCAAVILFAYDKWWTGPPPEKSVAVLPFANISGDPDQEFFSDGLSEELLNVLAAVPELTVISRSSAFSFKGKDVAIPDVAQQLNVAHVLEGSVRRDGKRVRITAQLIEASSDAHLWSETYDRDLHDIFAVQEEIASAIGDALKLRLVAGPGGAKQPAVTKTASMDAYDAYLHGRELLRLRGQHVKEAIRHFEHALRLDADFAPAHAQLAIATIMTTPSLRELKQKVTPHLDRAQELEPELAEAHGGRALLALRSGEPERTIKLARLALESNSGYSDAMNWLQLALFDVGRRDEGFAILERMTVIDPLDVVGRFNYIWGLGEQGRTEEAHEVADQLLALSPAFAYAAHFQTSLIWEGNIAEGLYWALLAQAEDPKREFFGFREDAFVWVGEYSEARRLDDQYSYRVDVAEGKFDEAVQETQRRLRLDPDDPYVIVTAADVLYDTGRIDEALPLYERLRDFAPEGRPINGSHDTTMRLALARRRAGDEKLAQAAADIVRKDLRTLKTSQQSGFAGGQYLAWAEAILAAFDGNPDDAFDALRRVLQLGLRDPQVFDDPLFENMRDDKRLIAIREDLDEILQDEHEKVLQLICFNNPRPDNWQPLPETCEDVEERRP